MHEYGQGGEKNLAKAVEWFRKAAEAGNEVPQTALGRCYLEGIGVEINLTTAREWFEESAAQDCENGQLNLGKMMIKGEGGPSIFIQGAALLEKAAEAGSDEAKRILTGMVALC